MKYIDLLPKKEKEVNKRTIALNTVIALMVVILGLMAASVFFINNMNKNLYASLQRHQEAGAELEHYVSRLEIYKEFEQKVLEKGELVEEVADNTILWSEILYNLSQAMPLGTHITAYEGRLADLDNHIKDYSEESRNHRVNSFAIRGYAKQYADVSKLLINLRKIPYIKDTWVRNISKSQVTENLTGTSFYIETFWDIPKIAEDWEIEEKKVEPVQEEDLDEIIGQ